MPFSSISTFAQAQGLPHGAHFQSIPAAFDEKFVASWKRNCRDSSTSIPSKCGWEYVTFEQTGLKTWQ